MIPIYIFYSMFGFQRTGDGLWAAADQMARGFVLGATAGRTTLTGEGLQHDDGHSLLLAAHEPGRGRVRPGVVVRDRAHRQGRPAPDVRRAGRGRLLLPDRLQRAVRAAGRAGRPRRRGPAARPVPVPGGAGGRRPARPDPGLRCGDAVGAAGAASCCSTSGTCRPTCGPRRRGRSCAATPSRPTGTTSCTRTPSRACRT